MTPGAIAPRARAQALLFHAGGLHARPAIKITKLAKRFAARVQLAAAAQGPWVDAKSVARVMGMKTPSRSTLFFEAEGYDAEDAVAALVRLVESDFANGEDADA